MAAQQQLPTIRGLDYLNAVVFTPIFDLPLNDNKFLRIIHSIFTGTNIFLMFAYIPFAVGHRLLELYRSDIGDFLSLLEGSFNVYGAIIKVICIIFGMSRLHKANELFDKLDARCTDSDEVEERLRGVHSARKLSLIYIAMYYGFFVSLLIESCIKARPPYCFYLFGIDWQRSSIEFYLTLFIDLLSTSAVLAQNIFNDCYAGSYLALLGAHMRILLLRVSKLGKSEDSTPKENSEALKLCIQDYQNIMSIRKLIAPLISKTIFLQYIVMVIMYSLILMHILLLSPGNSETVKETFYLGAVCLQVLPTCYFSSLLREDSNRMTTKIFGSEWFGKSREYRGMIVNFMLYAQAPMHFTAGKIFDISLQTFINVAKLSFSLYTCIKAVDLKTKMGF